VRKDRIVRIREEHHRRVFWLHLNREKSIYTSQTEMKKLQGSRFLCKGLIIYF